MSPFLFPIARKIVVNAAIVAAPIILEKVLIAGINYLGSKAEAAEAAGDEARRSAHGRSGGTMDIGEDGHYKKDGYHGLEA